MKGLIVCLSVFIEKRHLQSHAHVAKALHGLEQVKVLPASMMVVVNRDRFLRWHKENEP